MRKKFLSTVLALTMVVTMAVGCGKRADTNSRAKKGDEKVTLKTERMVRVLLNSRLLMSI